MAEPEPERTSEPLLDPDCRDGKCGSCVGGPCEHDCHREPSQPESHSIKIHMLPAGFDLADERWAAMPLNVLTVGGKVLACLNCGSVVPPDLMSVHERRCTDA